MGCGYNFVFEIYHRYSCGLVFSSAVYRQSKHVTFEGGYNLAAKMFLPAKLLGREPAAVPRAGYSSGRLPLSPHEASTLQHSEVISYRKECPIHAGYSQDLLLSLGSSWLVHH